MMVSISARFAEQELIGNGHPAVLHIFAQLGDQLDVEILPELFKERSTEIASVSSQFSKKPLG